MYSGMLDTKKQKKKIMSLSVVTTFSTRINSLANSFTITQFIALK